MVLNKLPSTGKSILIILSLIAAAIVAIFAIQLGTVLLGWVLIAVAAFVLWVIGVRLLRFALNWSPFGGSGGGA